VSAATNDRHSLSSCIESINASLGEGRRINLDEAVLERLIEFLRLLRRWNQRIRLVGSTEGQEAISELLGDSLVPELLLDKHRTLLDVGSGAGLPGAILAIARPGIRIVTIEPIHKKHAFQKTAKRELEIGNLEPRVMRLEAVEDAPFPAAISRATWPIAEWFARGLEIVEPGGRVIGFVNDTDGLPSDAQVLTYRLPHRPRHVVWVDKPAS